MEFQKQHGLVDTPETLANGHPGDVQNAAALLEIDELSRELVAATADRILREAEYRAALRGDPEMVLASEPRLQNENGNAATGLLAAYSKSPQRPGTGTDATQHGTWHKLSASGGDSGRLENIDKQIQERTQGWLNDSTTP